MALVSATVAIAAITAVAGAEKSEWQAVTTAPLQSAPELSSHLVINTIVVTAAVTVTDRDPPCAACAVENNSFWSTSTSL